ncbi:MAG TPA: hypothetical protein VK783_15325 [Bacteroidia bacterium]|nr:hypothetical protein [Bacteroidia bacterium]
MRKHYLKTIYLSFALGLLTFIANGQSRIADEFNLGDSVTGAVKGKVFFGVVAIKVDNLTCVVKWNNGVTDTSYYAYIHKKGSIDLQSQRLTYQTAIGGAADEYGTAVVSTPDSGNIISGYMNLNTGTDIDHDADPASGLLLKVDKNGNLLWMKSYGSLLRDILTCDDGCIGVGRYNANGNPQVYIIKTGKDGSLVWEKKIQDSLSSWAEGYSINKLKDGSFVITGTRKLNSGPSQILVLKINSNGDILWQKSLGDNANFTGVKSVENADGEIIVMGYGHVSARDFDQVQLIKLDNTGNVKWAKPVRTKLMTRGYDVLYLKNEKFIAILGEDNMFVTVNEQGEIVSNDFKRNRHNGGDCLRKLFYVSDSALGDVGVGANNSFSKNQGCFDVQPLERKNSSVKGFDKMYGNNTNSEFYNAVLNADNTLTLVGFTTGFGGGGSDIYIARVDREGNTSAPLPFFIKQIKQNSKDQSNQTIAGGNKSANVSPTYTQMLNNPNPATVSQYIEAVIATQDAISGQ